MELTATQILDYIHFLDAKHRATLNRLKEEGKTYRSRDVTRENGYLNALSDIRDTINEPRRAEELRRGLGLMKGKI